MEAAKYPPLTTAALVSYNHLGPFSEVVPADKMAELERRYEVVINALSDIQKETVDPVSQHRAESAFNALVA